MNKLETVAREVIIGKWGDGDERRKRLTKAGYNYAEVQAIVNKLLNADNKRKEEPTDKTVLTVNIDLNKVSGLILNFEV
jgi:hypothetical protein